jgi:hypothetical protein
VSDRTRTLLAASAALLLLGLTAGCGGPPRAKVSGTVTLDGQPVESGTISFYPTANSGPTAGGGIENGRYTLEASPGEMTVVISANKVVGKHKMFDTKDSPVVDKVAEVIPERYNKTSELKVTLKPGVNDEVNFELTTKKK